MKETFHLSMLWFHTWAGVVLGSLLFAIFWMGTLSVFDQEIDRWMMPGTRIEAPADVRLDALRPDIERIAAGAPEWGVSLPSERSPIGYLWYQDTSATWHNRQVDLAGGALVPDQGTLAGTGFLYPFHYSLHLQWKGVGYWLVGLAAMAMLSLLVSGVIIHRRIFLDFFTFRPEKKLPRSSLDLHNLAGVVALPFHFVIPLSGLIIFMNVYFPQAPGLAYAGEEDPADTFLHEAYPHYEREALGEPGALVSLDAMVRAAEAEWGTGTVGWVGVHHPGDANAIVEVYSDFADEVVPWRSALFFDGATGELLDRVDPGAPVMTAQQFLGGLHFIAFEHGTLRWLYFFAGLSGCVLIATGFIYWLETRRRKHEKHGLKGVRIVEGLAVGSVTGILIATLSFFVVNRLLPLGFAFAGADRPALEVWTFYLVWIATFAHAWSRPRRAWREQCGVIAVLAVAAVVLNAITTGDHLLRSFAVGLWPVFGMDVLLLAGAAVAVLVVRKLRDQPAAPVEEDAKVAPPSPGARPAARPVGASGDGASPPPAQSHTSPHVRTEVPNA